MKRWRRGPARAVADPADESARSMAACGNRAKASRRHARTRER
ncbi:hypothetical protein ACFWBF_19030 [Streptomyces sp. NPDC060028]